MSYNVLDLVVDEENVYCRQHHLETCKVCNYDFKPLNTLHQSLIPIKGNIPPPHYINHNLSERINKLKNEGNNYYKSKNYSEAIKLYSSAIELALQRPSWESHELAEQ